MHERIIHPWLELLTLSHVSLQPYKDGVLSLFGLLKTALGWVHFPKSTLLEMEMNFLVFTKIRIDLMVILMRVGFKIKSIS